VDRSTDNRANGPNPDASIGVAAPLYIPPKTTLTNKRGKITPFREYILSFQDALSLAGIFGAKSGFRTHLMKI
jgi:hypothetical protein